MNYIKPLLPVAGEIGVNALAGYLSKGSDYVPGPFRHIVSGVGYESSYQLANAARNIISNVHKFVTDDSEKLPFNVNLSNRLATIRGEHNSRRFHGISNKRKRNKKVSDTKRSQRNLRLHSWSFENSAKNRHYAKRRSDRIKASQSINSAVERYLQT
jgi:hypothetical protein